MEKQRYDSHSGGEREIQRTMLELLNQLDGFDSKGDVKVESVPEYMYMFHPVDAQLLFGSSTGQWLSGHTYTRHIGTE